MERKSVPSRFEILVKILTGEKKDKRNFEEFEIKHLNTARTSNPKNLSRLFSDLTGYA